MIADNVYWLNLGRPRPKVIDGYGPATRRTTLETVGNLKGTMETAAAELRRSSDRNQNQRKKQKQNGERQLYSTPDDLQSDHIWNVHAPAGERGLNTFEGSRSFHNRTLNVRNGSKTVITSPEERTTVFQVTRPNPVGPQTTPMGR